MTTPARVDQLAAQMRVSRADDPSISQPLADPGRVPGDPRQAMHVERLTAARPPQQAPSVGAGIEVGG